MLPSPYKGQDGPHHTADALRGRGGVERLRDRHVFRGGGRGLPGESPLPRATLLSVTVAYFSGQGSGGEKQFDCCSRERL